MKIGLDFDNTLACYSTAFYDAALSQGLIDKQGPKTKLDIRNYLRTQGKEDDWTKLQGYVYGPGMKNATLFDGVVDFLNWCKEQRHELCIVSHRTKHPFLGEQYDLHTHAQEWIQSTPLRDFVSSIFFELTKEDKAKRIKEQGCELFIDDLPEFLAHPDFPSISKVLFDPHYEHKNYDGLVLHGWDHGVSVVEQALVEQDVFTVGKQYFGKNPSVNRLKGGRNNCVYQLTADDKSVVAKRYYPDRLSRMEQEHAFLNAVSSAVVPKVLLRDDDHLTCLYSFVKGTPIDTVGESEVTQAAQFIQDINQSPVGLGDATESCFSVSSHVTLVQKRMEMLSDVAHEGAKEFVSSTLVPLWRSIQETIQQQTQEQPELGDELVQDQKILSPSDFGFHNALSSDGIITFLDFEYAGYDDPAKLIGDFFSQPQVRVPIEYYELFVQGVLQGREDKELQAKRAQLLLPLFELKWCCIMLNEFIPSHAKRRHIALKPDHTRAEKQLQKVQEYVKTIKVN